MITYKKNQKNQKRKNCFFFSKFIKITLFLFFFHFPFFLVLLDSEFTGKIKWIGLSEVTEKEMLGVELDRWNIFGNDGTEKPTNILLLHSQNTFFNKI